MVPWDGWMVLRLSVEVRPGSMQSSAGRMTGAEVEEILAQADRPVRPWIKNRFVLPLATHPSDLSTTSGSDCSSRRSSAPNDLNLHFRAGIVFIGGMTKAFSKERSKYEASIGRRATKSDRNELMKMYLRFSLPLVRSPLNVHTLAHRLKGLRLLEKTLRLFGRAWYRLALNHQPTSLFLPCSGTVALKKLSETTSPWYKGREAWFEHPHLCSPRLTMHLSSAHVKALLPSLEVQWEGIGMGDTALPLLPWRVFTNLPPTTPALHGRLKPLVRHVTSTSYMVPNPAFSSLVQMDDQDETMHTANLRSSMLTLAGVTVGHLSPFSDLDVIASTIVITTRMLRRAAIPSPLDETLNIRDFHLMGPGPLATRVWIDIESFRIRRASDRSIGVRWRLGMQRPPQIDISRSLAYASHVLENAKSPTLELLLVKQLVSELITTTFSFLESIYDDPCIARRQAVGCSVSILPRTSSASELMNPDPSFLYFQVEVQPDAARTSVSQYPPTVSSLMSLDLNGHIHKCRTLWVLTPSSKLCSRSYGGRLRGWSRRNEPPYAPYSPGLSGTLPRSERTIADFHRTSRGRRQAGILPGLLTRYNDFLWVKILTERLVACSSLSVHAMNAPKALCREALWDIPTGKFPGFQTAKSPGLPVHIPRLNQQESLASTGYPREDSRESTSECPDFSPCKMIPVPGWKFTAPGELQGSPLAFPRRFDGPLEAVVGIDG
ncbi:hypothetical protein BKA70DRAFT_1220326 [Coprinopsis sp. MPI-PUGE-AT-0042]|nr:hypothetical protein BKA70DRAFT_1220326 [Coprinopsis sp. MPI-PUGE-AT-0042]